MVNKELNPNDCKKYIKQIHFAAALNNDGFIVVQGYIVAEGWFFNPVLFLLHCFKQNSCCKITD